MGADERHGANCHRRRGSRVYEGSMGGALPTTWSLASRIRSRNAPTCQSVTPFIRTGAGRWPMRDHLQTVAGDTASSAATTGRRTCAADGNESNCCKADRSIRFNLRPLPPKCQGGPRDHGPLDIGRLNDTQSHLRVAINTHVKDANCVRHSAQPMASNSTISTLRAVARRSMLSTEIFRSARSTDPI